MVTITRCRIDRCRIRNTPCPSPTLAPPCRLLVIPVEFRPSFPPTSSRGIPSLGGQGSLQARTCLITSLNPHLPIFCPLQAAAVARAEAKEREVRTMSYTSSRALPLCAARKVVRPLCAARKVVRPLCVCAARIGGHLPPSLAPDVGTNRQFSTLHSQYCRGFC